MVYDFSVRRDGPRGGFRAEPIRVDVMLFQPFKGTRRLKDCEERLESLERAFKKLQLEWEDTYDRLRVLMQRVVKRAQTIEKLAKELPEDQESILPQTPRPDGEQALSDRQNAINAQILRRRQRGVEQ